MSSHIAFIGTPNYHEATLYLMDVGTDHVQQVPTEDSIEEFRWSPDGQSLLLRVWGTRGERISLLDLAEWRLRHLTEEASGRLAVTWSWSPDSKQIALTFRYPGATYLIDRATGRSRLLAQEAAFPVWSQATGELAFRWTFQNQDIFVMSPDGTHRRLFFHCPFPLKQGLFPCWSPDARSLACPLWRPKGQANKEDDVALLILTADEHPTLLHHWDLYVSDLAWSPDSQSIACIGLAPFREGERASLWVAGITETLPRRVAPIDGDAVFAWSPNSRDIAFTSWTEEYRRFSEYSRIQTYREEDAPSYEMTMALFITGADGRHLRQALMIDTDMVGDFAPHKPTWSPDSTQVAYTSPGHEYCHMVNADGTSLRCLSDVYAAYLREEEELDENEDLEEPIHILSPQWQPA
jgi:Tol biopolymer transport system component